MYKGLNYCDFSRVDTLTVRTVGLGRERRAGHLGHVEGGPIVVGDLMHRVRPRRGKSPVSLVRGSRYLRTSDASSASSFPP